ncbi:hypothetical protein [Caulobacter sp.]|uniref:hypothetical protein n=1 Tax=Caulobacter sp. TaxID=78 RepID=UPI002B48BA03|nr:hypothetical protein [Caulobacter sp.]HJV42449.1 hypothetical protein [Caulobacter sp.]
MSVGVRISGDDRRRAAILAGSLLLHVVVLAWLALPVPPLLETLIADDLPTVTAQLIRPEREERPRPRPAPASAAAPPAPSLPFQVRQPVRPAPAGVPTLAVPAAGIARPGTAVRPAPLPGEGAGDLRTALRGSATGCVSADAVGLNRREREKCDERFGAAQPRGTYAGPLNATKAREFEAQAIMQELARKANDAPMGPGVDHRSKDQPGTMKEIPFVLGAEQDGLGRTRNAQQQRLKQLDDYRKAEARAKQRSRENDQR